jgi:S-adenosyl methyltransferase
LAGDPDLGIPDLRTDVPHSARIYDYLLGGKDNFEADRGAAAGITADWPNLPKSMRANRDFMRRVGRYLAAELGIRQFLDIGTGLPTAPNLHEVVQQVAPEARIVYVDNDPIVLTHARALLTSSRQGRTTYIDADLRDPAAIINSSQIRETLDFTKPVALSLLAIVHFMPDDDEVRRIIREFTAVLPAGSALALSTTNGESAPEEVAAGVAAYNASGIPLKTRSIAEAEALFDGLDLVAPGVVLVNHWWPDDQMPGVLDEHVHICGGVAVKP